MKIVGAIMVAAALAGLAGCASAPPQGAGGVPPSAGVPAKRTPVDPPLPVAAPPADAAPSAAPEAAAAVAAPAAATPTAESQGRPAERSANAVAPLPLGQFAILVESQPTGATVVVDGIPVGRAPRRVVVAGTSQGYFEDPMSIKVRFVATDANSTSQTVEEALTPRDRIPAALIFTPTGAQRRMP